MNSLKSEEEEKIELLEKTKREWNASSQVAVAVCRAPIVEKEEKVIVREMFLLVLAVLVAADECPPVFGSSINLTAAAYQVKMAPIKSSGLLTLTGQPF